MFGSTNPFGQSSSPFGSSQSVFGQQNNTNNNPFPPKPFGSPTPFGSQQTGNSVFGGTSTGVFGAAQTPSPFSSNTFGASSSPAFGTSMPAFGASSTPAFGNSSSSFGGSSVFGQKPAFGGFGSTPTQTSPFGSATQPSQPAFGSKTQQSQPAFGSSIFGSTGTPAFGATSTPAFGATSTPAFGAPSNPAFGAPSTPAFGATSTPAFGSTSTSAFGNTGGAFGMSNTTVFGGGGGFGASSSPVFGSSSTPAFGASSSPAFGASSAPGFSFGSTTPAFSQSSSAFGTSSPFGSTTSAFGGQSSAFGSQTPTQAFGSTGIGQSGFGGQRGGSRIASYSATVEADSGTSGQSAKLESISAMPVYKDKSHEELRWEDYQLGDKGGPHASAPLSTGMPGFNSSTTQTNVFGQSPANPFSSSTTPNSNPFAQKTFGTSAPAFSSPAFPSSSSSAAAPSIFGTPASGPFGANSSSQPVGSSTSLFGGQGTSSQFSTNIFGNTQPSLFNTSAPTNAQSGFGQNTSQFGQTGAFNQPSMFNQPSSGNLFSSSPSLTSNALTGFGQAAPSMSTPFQSTPSFQSTGTFSFSNFTQTQPGISSREAGTTPNDRTSSEEKESTLDYSLSDDKMNDRISDLPDCIMSCILKKLPMQDLVKTSVLSKKWYTRWALGRRLYFDIFNMFGSLEKLLETRVLVEDFDHIGAPEFYLPCDYLDDVKRYVHYRCFGDFVKRVNQFVKKFPGTKIDSFLVNFCLDARQSRTIDQWIRFAIARGVERIDLLFLGRPYDRPGYNISDDPCYKLDLALFSETNASTLNHMRLENCLLCHPTNYDFLQFQNLRSLSLERVNLDETFIESLLSNCTRIEELCLLICEFKSSMPVIASSSLRHLNIIGCYFTHNNDNIKLFLDLTSLHCPKLTSLELCSLVLTLSGDGQENWNFNVPMLKRIKFFISLKQKFNTLVSRCATCFPELETMDLTTFSMAATSPQITQPFKHLRHLNLLVYVDSYILDYLNYDPLWIINLLQASPLLQKLSVMFGGTEFLENQKDIRDVEGLSHDELKVVELGGCVGNWYEIEFVVNVLKYVHKLEQIVVMPYGREADSLWKFESGCKRMREKLQGVAGREKLVFIDQKKGWQSKGA